MSHAEDARARADLHAVPGTPGAGRVRYAAAMYFHRKGQISDAALEVYRACSPHDWLDPAELLVARGLSVDLPPPRAPELVTRRLLDEIDRYIATLAGGGVAEVRRLIAKWRDGEVSASSSRNAVVDAHLGPALAQMEDRHPALAAAIRAAAPHLPWITYDLYPPDEIGEAFRTGHAFASLIGEEAVMPAESFDLGLFLIAPHVLYRDHCHPAPELYAPLTGPHGWRFAPDAPLIVKPADEPVWNLPNAPHLTKVGPVPFLCIFAWTGDVNFPARVLPAKDWAELEHLRLEG